MEENKLKSHGGKAVVISAPAESSAAPIAMVTEQDVQLHSASQTRVGASLSAATVASSAERARRVARAHAELKLARAEMELIYANDDMVAGSQAGSVGRRLEDVRSDTGSSGPSPPMLHTTKENPFEGIFSSSSTPTITTPTIHDVFSEKREVHMID